MSVSNSHRAGGVNLWLWAGIGAILLIPAIAMPFTREVNWGVGDFIFAAVLLIGGGAVYEIAIRKLPNPRMRTLVSLMLLGFVLLIWAEAAVGILH